MFDSAASLARSALSEGAHGVVALTLWLWRQGTPGQVVLGMIALVILGVLLWLLSIAYGDTTQKPSDNTSVRKAYQLPVKLPKTGNRGPIDRHVQQWKEPIKLGALWVETWMKHIAIGATTGARKTTILAMLIMQANRPVVLIAGDSSPYAIEAMRARGWRVWTRDGKYGGLYVHEGTPDEAAQIVTILVDRGQNDTGMQRGIAQGVFRRAYEEMDAKGEVRSWPALRKALIRARAPEGLKNQNFEHARVNWLNRIDSLTAALGPGLGNELSVLECVRSEVGFAFDLNAFSDMELAADFGKLAVRLTQHAADKTGDFWWMVDELALFDAKLLGQIVRTCRIRRVKFVGASQIISDFGSVLKGLVKVWFVGEQTAADHESRKWCSDLTMGRVPQENFAEHATPPGFYYVHADGRTQEIQIEAWNHPRPISPMPVYPTRRVPNVATASASPRHNETPEENAHLTDVEHSEKCDPDDTLALHEAPDVSDVVPAVNSVSSVSQSVLSAVVPPDIAMQTSDGRRVWGRGKPAVCHTLDHASPEVIASVGGWVREGLKKPHRFWVGGDNGNKNSTETKEGESPKSPRPKVQVKKLYGEEKGQRTTSTVYVWWYELVIGKPIPDSRPSMDHLCHTYDDSCPGPNLCEVEGCDDPAHPEGMPCQHTLCYEIAHLEPVPAKGKNGNPRRQSDQKKRHVEWLKKNQQKKAA